MNRTPSMSEMVKNTKKNNPKWSLFRSCILLSLYTVNTHKHKGFTLVEMLIVVGIMAVMVMAVIVLINPVKMTNSAVDTKKKSELSRFKKALEEYYNDKGCYPKPEHVCYPGVDNGSPVTGTVCYMCGKEENSPQLTGYLDELPCDPQHPQKRYQYQVNDASNCPKWFKVFTDLNVDNDLDSLRVGCGNGGCGGTSQYGYDYGEGSLNIVLPVSHNYVCHTYSNTCDVCGRTVEACQQQTTCREIYGNLTLCCNQFPKPIGCP